MAFLAFKKSQLQHKGKWEITWFNIPLQKRSPSQGLLDREAAGLHWDTPGAAIYGRTTLASDGYVCLSWLGIICFFEIFIQVNAQ